MLTVLFVEYYISWCNILLWWITNQDYVFQKMKKHNPFHFVFTMKLGFPMQKHCLRLLSTPLTFVLNIQSRAVK